MRIEEVADLIGAMEGVLVLKPEPGDGSPEIAWGDLFFYYAPDGIVPKTQQPFATIVTKNYPGDETSRLDRPGAYRLNVAAGADEFRRRTGHESAVGGGDDVVIPHPAYGGQGWLAVVNPGEKTSGAIRELLELAHGLARQRFHRHANRGRD